MKELKVYILLILILFANHNLQAQDVKNQFNPVNTGVTSLSIAPDSRGGAMGDVGAATDPDVNSQFWNPAKYPFTVSRAGVSLSYTPWLRQLVNDIDLAYVAGYYRIGDYQALSASLRYFSLGEVTVGQSSAQDIGYTINPYEMSFDVGYSRMLSENLSAAVALRFIYSDLAYRQDEDVTPGSAFAADVAMYYNRYVMMGQRECNLAFGMNISNIGSKISYDSGNTSEFIPTNLRLGGSLLMPIDEYNTFAISADANKLLVPTRPLQKDGETDTDYQDRLQRDYRDMSPISGIFKSFSDAPGGFKEEMQEVQWSIGAEYTYHQQFSVRGGYHYENQNKGNRKYFSVGAGFKMNVFSFDIDGIKDIFGKK